jgi:hypothetical protein
MAIFVGTTKKINRNTLSATKKYLFNTSRVGELKADGDDSILKYTRNILDRRESADEYKIDEASSVVTPYFGGDDSLVTLSVLKKKVDALTKDYVATIHIPLQAIGFGWADPDDATKSWIEVYPNAFKKVEYQVALSIDQLNGISNILTYQFLDAGNDAFTGGNVTGTINYATGAIAITVPALTVVTALIATFSLSTGASAKISTTAQVSGTTANNFTSAVTYIITGANGQVRNFVVTVTVTP